MGTFGEFGEVLQGKEGWWGRVGTLNTNAKGKTKKRQQTNEGKHKITKKRRETQKKRPNYNAMQ